MLKKYIGDKDFYKYVLAVAVPIMLQNGITNFVSMLDNIMVGRIGSAEMAGVSIANQLIFVFSLCLFGAVSGVGIFGAQFYGKQDNEGMRHTFRFKVILCLALTAAGVFVFLHSDGLIRQYLVNDVSGDAEAAFQSAKKYLFIMLTGLLPYAAVQCYSSTLRETGETLLPMKAGVAAVVINLGFNYVLIFGHFGAPRLGVAGAAIATVISRFAEFAVVVIWSHRHTARFPFLSGVYQSFRIPPRLALDILIKGMPLMINEAMWAAGVTRINMYYATRGLTAVLATNISSTFWNVFSVTFMATGTAIGIIIGQMLGAGRLDEVRDTDRKLIAFSLAVSVLVGAIYFVCAGYIPMLYKTDAAARAAASGIMRISACLMPVNAFMHASYFTLRSGGRSFITFLFDSCFMWVISVPTAFLLATYTNIGLLPLYFFCQSVDLVKCVVGFILIKKGVWIRNLVGEKT